MSNVDIVRGYFEKFFTGPARHTEVRELLTDDDPAIRWQAGAGVLALVAALVVSGTSPATAQAPGDAEAATPFTGDVKPVLYVEDVERSVPFFRDVLGFEFLGYADSGGRRYYAEMAAGPRKFGLHEPLNEEHEPWVGHQRLYFRVEDIAAHRRRVASRGGSPGEPIETDWMDMFIVRDPDGHQIVFAATDPAKHSMDPWKARP